MISQTKSSSNHFYVKEKMDMISYLFIRKIELTELSLRLCISLSFIKVLKPETIIMTIPIIQSPPNFFLFLLILYTDRYT